MARGRRVRLATGIYQDAHGYAVVWPEHGEPKEKRFPADAPLDRLKKWRARTIGQLADLAAVARGGSFVRDVVTFLKTRRSRPSFKADRAHLRPWVHRFPHRSRWAITRDDVQTAIAAWEAAGYSPRELRHRVRILRQLYHALDGSRAPTPCDDVSLPRVPRTRPISVSAALVREVALTLRAHEMDGIGRLRTAKTRARYLVLATTGQRPAQVKRAQPIDVDLERRIWFVRPAKGDAGAIVYLNDDMVAAWTLFATAQAWGRYDGRSFVKTLRRCGWPKGVRPYNLRHTVGLTLSELGVDLGDIQAHMGHVSPETTRIYVPGVLARLKDASQKLDGRIPAAALTVPCSSAMSPTGRKAKAVDFVRQSEGRSGRASARLGRGTTNKSA